MQNYGDKDFGKDCVEDGIQGDGEGDSEDADEGSSEGAEEGTGENGDEGSVEDSDEVVVMDRQTDRHTEIGDYRVPLQLKSFLSFKILWSFLDEFIWHDKVCKTSDINEKYFLLRRTNLFCSSKKSAHMLKKFNYKITVIDGLLSEISPFLPIQVYNLSCKFT